mmetsp:Transcript_176577/g.566154  ORF Transcript_176577/g.566154 Transcript_176577/m.566154 type:complete len:223 (+) Transcript_176577:2183-2851(+)
MAETLTSSSGRSRASHRFSSEASFFCVLKCRPSTKSKSTLTACLCRIARTMDNNSNRNVIFSIFKMYDVSPPRLKPAGLCQVQPQTMISLQESFAHQLKFGRTLMQSMVQRKAFGVLAMPQPASRPRARSKACMKPHTKANESRGVPKTDSSRRPVSSASATPTTAPSAARSERRLQQVGQAAAASDEAEACSGAGGTAGDRASAMVCPCHSGQSAIPPAAI